MPLLVEGEEGVEEGGYSQIYDGEPTSPCEPSYTRSRLDEDVVVGRASSGVCLRNDVDQVQHDADGERIVFRKVLPVTRIQLLREPEQPVVYIEVSLDALLERRLPDEAFARWHRMYRAAV